jgi:hypothetical protein
VIAEVDVDALRNSLPAGVVRGGVLKCLADEVNAMMLGAEQGRCGRKCRVSTNDAATARQP